ncbi:MAG: hypothetical protein Q9201_001790 [Fulgogasparrea decipioides]
MDQWLDSLSEDWVSQPGSPRSDQLRRSSSALSVGSHTSNVSQSRIPRYKPRVGSHLAKNGPVSSKRVSSGSEATGGKKVLEERSSSNLNIPRNQSAGSRSQSKSPGARKDYRLKQHSSPSSATSIPQDTIQRKTLRVSPAKENGFESTPEWRRRVLQGKAGAAGPDLFGPIGLESIFKPPPNVGRASNPDGKQKRGKKFQPATVDDYPSSPPSFPSDIASIERSGGTDKRRASLLNQMEILEEVSEGDSRNNLPDTDYHEQDELDGIRMRYIVGAPDSATPEEDHNEVLSQVILSKRHGHNHSPHVEVALSAAESEHRNTLPEAESCARGVPSSREDGSRPTVSASPSVSAQEVLLASDWTSHSLPDDLSTGTDLYVANGGFVSIRRGCYSNEGSFQRRPLSPSSLPDFDAPELRSPSPAGRRLSTKSRRSSAPENLTDQPRSAPVTPQRKQHAKSSSVDEQRSSGSPLKLFDKYDTFTNERLVRRISKFEQFSPESEEELFHEKSKQKSVRAAENNPKAQKSHPEVHLANTQRSRRRPSSFGAGQLDSYPFQANYPLESKSRSAANGVSEPSASHRQGGLFRSQEITVATCGTGAVDVQINATLTANGKRLPHSPAKESQAKRRCTLRSSENMKLKVHQRHDPDEVSVASYANANRDRLTSNQVADAGLLKSNSIAGKKRKDARYDSDSRVADPSVIALRQILRPRTSTTGHTHKGTRNVADLAGLPSNMDGSHDEAGSPVMDLDHETKALAGELATFTLNMAQDMTQGCRKASVTTADFFNEAKQIMQLIRNQGRPQSSHGISEEPEDEEEESGPRPTQFDESTIDEFSRPPSREGGGPRRLREPAAIDARVASHLRKFEDTDDLGLALPSSAKSMHLHQSHDPSLSPNKSVDGDVQNDGSYILSDLPNIRIRAHGKGQPHEDEIQTKPEGHRIPTSTRARSSGSQSSSEPSTDRSEPTGSSRGSRGSGTRAVIAPQVVSHLLSDNMGAMTFDHSKQVWIKRRGSWTSQGADTHSRSGSDITENLFQDIPDLSVDELEEQQRTQRIVSSTKILGTASDRVSMHDHAAKPLVEDPSSRPQTRDSADTATVDQSSAPSRFSHFASSGPMPETRATSWGDEVLSRGFSHAKVQVHNENPLLEAAKHGEEVEHEISIMEGRTSETPRHIHHNQRQTRVVTVAFSSPLVDHVETLENHSDGTESENEGSDHDLPDSPVREGTRPSSVTQRRTSTGFGKRSAYRGVSRRASLGFARPMSRLDENEELTFLRTRHGPSNASLDLVVTTPLAVSRSTLLPSGLSSAQASSIGFQLSPLSEFTVHQDDHLAHRGAAQVVRHRGLLATHEVEGQLSLAVQDLVKKLTDVEPYEPYWDYIRHVDLRNRNLRSLHMLDEFCGHVEDLDVSNNELDQLNGAPHTIRHLKARGNCLSNLTSWGHLRNLQYLDVSGNQIQDLVGFHDLVHLRELRADDNHIKSLKGLLELNGLIKLRLRNNRVKSVNFEVCNLARLVHLDLRRNELCEVIHMNHLPALKDLDLGENNLQSVSFPEVSRSLEQLQLSDNQLHDLDIGQLPHLRSLNIDRNLIRSVTNLTTHPCLEVLSWREQHLDGNSPDASIQYQECHSVRELSLSGNILPTFAPDVHMLNLQHLELASTGLQSLSDDFGVKCPNLRVLNLNFNALTELRPLLGIIKLEKLYLVENRISRLRRTASVLDRIANQLAELDLRQNPLTLGHYTLQQQPQVVKEQQLTISCKGPRPEIMDEATLEDLEYRTAYLLPQMDQSNDDATRHRLDEDTKLRRRVYEMLVTLRCANLRRLDGLSLDRKKITSKDGVWERLRELGVITSKGTNGALELEA